ncbi:MAG: hypothetical protein JSS00_04355 [Proteobacteria bacterium]|nr:hypothetical protein [Pseudomonadota bacterium]
MRTLAVLAIFAAITVATARAAASGAYATAAAATAADCARLCDDDTLCIGWTYDGSACGLWASAPKHDAPLPFRLSNRAPGFVRPAHGAAVAPPEQPSPIRPEPMAVALLGGDDRPQDLRPRFGGN